MNSFPSQLDSFLFIISVLIKVFTSGDFHIKSFTSSTMNTDEEFDSSSFCKNAISKSIWMTRLLISNFLFAEIFPKLPIMEA